MPDLNSLLYFDHAATTPLAPEVLAALLPWLQSPLSLGNPSSIHQLGREARAALDDSRDAVANLLHADYSEIYFTSGGTEADNLALLGTLMASSGSRKHLVTTTIEHHAILHTAYFWETQGYPVTYVPVDSRGQVSVEAVRDALTEETALVSVMHANNEIGTLQPLAEIGALCKENEVLFHTDAVQTAGLLPLDVQEIGCDLLTLSAHKMYGPKGAGALYIRQGTKVSPLLHGGAQEREKRGGTENVAGIVGLGKAVELAQSLSPQEIPRLTSLRERLMEGLQNSVEGIRLNGHPTERLPHNVHLSVEGVEGVTLLMNLDRQGIAASSGSACSSGSLEPSHVLKAIGLSDTLASSGVRFTLGRGTTLEQVETLITRFSEIVHRMRR
jgi:cysteine desulfurase